MVFPFLAMFRMARILFRLAAWYAKTGEIPYANTCLRIFFKLSVKCSIGVHGGFR